jgi:hypothetical protein
LEDDSDCFTARPGHQLSSDRLLGDQTNSPPGVAFGRIGANHRDDTLLFRGTQQLSRTGPCFFVESPIQTTFLITVSD